VRLTYPQDAVVVVAGLPGAGKSTLIRRAVNPSVVRIVDTDDQRREGGRASYVRHYARILAAANHVAGPLRAVEAARATEQRSQQL